MSAIPVSFILKQIRFSKLIKISLLGPYIKNVRGGLGRRFYKFFRKDFAAQATTLMNISFNFLSKASLRKYFRVVFVIIFKAPMELILTITVMFTEVLHKILNLIFNLIPGVGAWFSQSSPILQKGTNLMVGGMLKGIPNRIIYVNVLAS